MGAAVRRCSPSWSSASRAYPAPLSLPAWQPAAIAGDEFKASLAPLLFQAQQRYADPVAADILLAIGQSLSRVALSLLERHSLLHDPFPVILAGGLFKGEGTLLPEAVSLNLHARAPQARLVLARHEPVLGALLFAFDPFGERVTAEQIGRMQATLPARGFFRSG